MALSRQVQGGLALAAVLWAGTALAAGAGARTATDPLVEGARQCTQYFPVEERKNNIPTHLLAAIATTESGRWHDGLGMSVPWPWTVNVEGKGYYYSSKAEAIANVQQFMAQGYKSIDVGCMQVNLKHHPKAFTDLNQAFDPAANVNYAARFLRDNYATLGDWIKATAAYHSRTPVHGQRYLGQIERSWNRIVGKVAAARAGSGAEPVKPSPVAAQMARAAQPLPRVVSGNSTKSAQRARVIEVSDASVRKSGVLVVHVKPEAQPEAGQVEVVAAAAPVPVVAAPAPAAAPTPAGSSVRRVSLDNSQTKALADPQFVFAN